MPFLSFTPIRFFFFVRGGVPLIAFFVVATRSGRHQCPHGGCLQRTLKAEAALDTKKQRRPQRPHLRVQRPRSGALIVGWVSINRLFLAQGAAAGLRTYISCATSCHLHLSFLFCGGSVPESFLCACGFLSVFYVSMLFLFFFSHRTHTMMP